MMLFCAEGKYKYTLATRETITRKTITILLWERTMITMVLYVRQVTAAMLEEKACMKRKQSYTTI